SQGHSWTPGPREPDGSSATCPTCGGPPCARPPTVDDNDRTGAYESLGGHPAAAGGRAELSPVPGYDILGVLGRGGMGVVYKARHVRLKRLVALKMVRAGPHAGPEERERFSLEAEAVARLQH